MEYASPVWAGLPNYLNYLLESIERKAMKIIFPSASYSEALDKAGLESLESRRVSACKSFANKCKTSSTLNKLFREPTTIHHNYNLRSGQTSVHPSLGQTDRLNNFITVKYQ